MRDDFTDGLADRDRVELRHRLGLTPRQYSILIRMAEGKGYRCIGREMGLSLTTVKRHVRRMWRVQCVDNNIELIARYVRAVQPALVLPLVSVPPDMPLGVSA
jgi:DNA-binding NarL/FixJ family response regulator